MEAAAFVVFLLALGFPISWDKFFEGSSIFMQIYILEIIEEIMEAGNVMGDNRRIYYVGDQVK